MTLCIQDPETTAEMNTVSLIDKLQKTLAAEIEKQIKWQKSHFFSKFKARFGREVPELLHILYRDLDRHMDANLGTVISRSLEAIGLEMDDEIDVPVEPKTVEVISKAAPQTVVKPTPNVPRPTLTNGHVRRKVPVPANQPKNHVTQNSILLRRKSSPVSVEDEQQLFNQMGFYEASAESDSPSTNGDTIKIDENDMYDDDTRSSQAMKNNVVSQKRPQSTEMLQQNGYGPRKRKAPEPRLVLSDADGGASSFIKQCIICPIDQCFVINDSKRDLDYHLITFHSIVPFICVLKDCGRIFPDTGKLLHHQMNDHHTVTDWVCKDCDESNPSRLHLNRHHTQLHFHRVFRCAVGACKYNASTHDDVLQHIGGNHLREYAVMKTSTGEQVVVGKFSSKFPSVADDVSAPQKRPQKSNAVPLPVSTDPPQENLYCCPFTGCNTVHPNRASLLEHQNIHFLKKQFGCAWPECAFRSQDKAEVIRHISLSHIQNSQVRKVSDFMSPLGDSDPRQWLRILND